MRSRDLDRTILIEKPVKTQDPVSGNFTTEWVPLSTYGSPPVPETYAAQVQGLLPSRSEQVEGGHLKPSNAVRIRTRWRDDIKLNMRVTVYGDTNVVYQIIGGPTEIAGRKRAVELVVEKYVL